MQDAAAASTVQSAGVASFTGGSGLATFSASRAETKCVSCDCSQTHMCRGLGWGNDSGWHAQVCWDVS
jgi:uncharacterized membrane protein